MKLGSSILFGIAAAQDCGDITTSAGFQVFLEICVIKSVRFYDAGYIINIIQITVGTGIFDLIFLPFCSQSCLRVL